MKQRVDRAIPLTSPGHRAVLCGVLRLFASSDTAAGRLCRDIGVRCGLQTLAGGEAEPGAEEFLGIDRLAIDSGFIMEMRAGGADLADDLADFDGLAGAHRDCGEVTVTGR